MLGFSAVPSSSAHYFVYNINSSCLQCFITTMCVFLSTIWVANLHTRSFDYPEPNNIEGYFPIVKICLRNIFYNRFVKTAKQYLFSYSGQQKFRSLLVLYKLKQLIGKIINFYKIIITFVRDQKADTQICHLSLVFLTHIFLDRVLLSFSKP